MQGTKTDTLQKAGYIIDLGNDNRYNQALKHCIDNKINHELIEQEPYYIMVNTQEAIDGILRIFK